MMLCDLMLITCVPACYYLQSLLVQVISPDFPLELSGFFPGKHLIHFFGAQDEGFSEFRSR